MRASLLSEAGRDASHLDWQVFFFKNFIHVHCSHWMLGCCNEVKVFALNLVHDIFKILQVRHSLICLPSHHERRLNQGIVFLVKNVKRKLLKRKIKHDKLIFKKIKSCASYLASSLNVSQFRLNKVNMAFWLEIEFRLLANLLDCNVVIRRCAS